MQIIPVIDLLNDTVVRGVGGDRANYLPIQSRLCQSATPEDVVAALLRLHPFRIIYIADLNALQNTGNSNHIVAELQCRFPQVHFWVDGGFTEVNRIESCRGDGQISPIIASETTTEVEHYQYLVSYLKDANFILSLDHKAGRLGPAELFEKPSLWPQQVILMSLENVGADAGPNIDLLTKYRSLSSTTQFIAAGGVRHEQDLSVLKAHGAAAVLVASALHSGRISKEALQEYKKMPR